MGNKILIYDHGQTYEIESDLIYVPMFISAINNKTMHDIGMSKKLEIMKEDKDDTESKDEISH